MTTTNQTTNHLDQCTNCGRYGWHTSEKCPDLPSVPLPPDAVAVDDWEGTPLGRAIQGPNRGVTDSQVLVWTGACQLADGSVATAPGYLAPVINVELAQDLNSDQARELAAALLEAADEVDRWTAK